MSEIITTCNTVLKVWEIFSSSGSMNEQIMVHKFNKCLIPTQRFYYKKVIYCFSPFSYDYCVLFKKILEIIVIFLQLVEEFEWD